MNIFVEDMLAHRGVSILDGAPGRGSGRFPLGSGENPNQRKGDFLSRVDKLRSKGMSDTDIAKSMGLSTTQFRSEYSLKKAEYKSNERAIARNLRDEGYSPSEIARKMGYTNESSIRNLLREDTAARQNVTQATADLIKKQVDTYGMIDVGAGTELYLGISKERMRDALKLLQKEGYEVYGGGVEQVTNKGKQTHIRVICPPGTPHKDIYNYDQIHQLKEVCDEISYDDGLSFRKAFEYPSSMDSSRLTICYAEDGGIEKDGLIEIRRGVEDLSLGESTYAQVRILVDDNYYMKGMAIYSDDLPDGIDIRFNTNKSSGTPTTEVLKKIKSDPDNPFGSLIKEHGGQSYYDDPNGKYTDPITGKKQSLSLINKRAEEGDWGKWAKKLSSQFLSKQSTSLAKRQLNLSIADKEAELKDIQVINNPTVKKRMLESYAESCDYDSVHLKAAALPRQKYQVILPVSTMKDTEVYAPNYKDGEKVALIRYPHGGTFEIPILTVNNKQTDAKKMIGKNPKDAVCINSKVAERLSGADFDGDAVMVIPCNSAYSKVKISSTKSLKGLEGFDPKVKYGPDSSEPVKVIKNEEGKITKEYYTQDGKLYSRMKATQKEMGVISNLITDMTLKGAKEDELARAVRHSMVVIDAEKHKLNYKQSYEDNDIASLKKKYQGQIDSETGKYREGAATLVSRAKSQTSVIKRQGSPQIDPETGEVSYKTADDAVWVYKEGRAHTRTQKSTQMLETKDARTLISDLDTPMENLYADYANKMKALANTARKEAVNTKEIERDSGAAKTYAAEVASLEAKLRNAQRNAPKERQAQLVASSIVKAKKEEYPDLTNSEIKKISQQALTKARTDLGAKRYPIEITDEEWEAIQAGALSKTKVNQIVNNANIDTLKQKAMPKSQITLSDAKIQKMKSMKASGMYTNAEIAVALGVSTSTINNYLNAT